MDQLWPCPQCHSLNMASARRCYSCAQGRSAATADLTAVDPTSVAPDPAAPPVVVVARLTQDRSPEPELATSVEPPHELPDPKLVVDRGDLLPFLQDAFARFQRWVDAEPRVIPAAGIAAVAVVVLILVGIPALTAFALLLLGIVVVVGVGIYRIYGEAFGAAWQGPAAVPTSVPPAPVSATDANPDPHPTTGTLPPPAPFSSAAAAIPSIAASGALPLSRCPDCAEDVEIGAVTCPYCGCRLGRDHAQPVTIAPPPLAWTPAPVMTPQPQPYLPPTVTRSGTYGGAVLLFCAGVIVVIGVFPPGSPATRRMKAR